MATRSKRGRKAQPQARRKALAPRPATLAPRPAPGAPAGIEARRIDLVMRAVNEGVYDWDITGGTIYYSEGVHRATGMSPRHIRTPEDWRNRIHPEDLPGYDAALIAHFKGKTERFECDYRFRDRKGGWRWARQHGIAERDADGRAVRLVGSTGDITGLKQAEQSLREAQERLSLATQAATEGIYEWNLATGSLYLSDRAKAYFAVKGRKLTPAAWNALVLKEDFAGYQAAIAAFFKSRRMQFEHEYRLRKAGGGHCWILDRAVALRHAKGRVTRLVGAIADITQRKEAEIELRRARDAATEALERQSATAEIVKVITNSPADLQPTFRAILQSTRRLCESSVAALFLYDGKLLACAAHDNTTAAFARGLEGMRAPPSKDTPTRLAALRRKVVHVHDYLNDKSYAPLPGQLREKVRTVLSVPLLRHGKLVGVITTWRREVRPFADKHIALLQTFADQAVIAIENTRLFNETREALERQTATADVLASISGSMADTQPVFERIVHNMRRLFGTRFAVLQLLRSDGLIEMPAVDGEGIQRLRERYPRPIDETTVGGLAMLRKQPVQYAPVLDNPAAPEATIQFAKDFGFNSVIFTPMIHEGKVIGAIGAAQHEAKPFDERQVALIRTFADQAVIAIQNARLFNETREALERQTATAEILKVIASSPSDVQPVFDAIARSATRLLGGFSTAVIRVEGDQAQLAAFTSTGQSGDEALGAVFPVAVSQAPGSVGRAMREKTAQWTEDVEADTTMPEDFRAAIRARGWRSGLAVPMVRQGEVIGVINITRREAGRFSAHQIGLLTTFADQAVIAIENVRLFNETKEALEHQRASGEVLSAISSSVADTKPVFDKIAESCERLFAGDLTGVTVVDGAGRIVLAAYHGPNGAALHSVYPLPLSHDSGTGSAILDAAVKHFPDVDAPGVPPGVAAGCRTVGMKAIVFAPLVSKGCGIGAIWVGKVVAGAFPERDIALLKTFAEQAVIAIQNARLFNETKEALERQTATAEILKVIASSPSDVQPVLEAVALSAARLCDAMDVVVLLREGDALRFRVHHGDISPAVPMGETKAISRDWSAGRCVVEARQLHIHDILAAPDEFPDGSRMGKRAGYRTVLMTPLLRDGNVLGVIGMRRAEVRPFELRQIELINTFADQAVIAIENARLFNETKEALEQQKASADVLQVIAGSMADPQPVFEKILENCSRLFRGTTQALNLLDDDNVVHLAAQRFDLSSLPQVFSEAQQAAIRDLGHTAYPIKLQGKEAQWMRRGKDVYSVSDVLNDPRVGPALRAPALVLGFSYAQMGATMFSGDKCVGSIVVNRPVGEGFTAKEQAQLMSFADQAVIAIQNARLFRETNEALERQTATAEILKVIASSPSDVQPVFDAIVKVAARLFGRKCALRTVEAEGLRRRARSYELTPGEFHGPEVEPLDRGSIVALAVQGVKAVQWADTLVEGAAAYGMERARALSFRSIASAPLMRDGAAIGVISVSSPNPGKLSEAQMALLATFADQAVIAIENVRLFNETKEALERQTATAEILKVIASSPSDVQPVFDAIAASARRLLDGGAALVARRDGDLLQLAAYTSTNAAADEALKKLWPSPITGKGHMGRAVLSASPVLVDDIQNDTSYSEAFRESARTRGLRSVVSVPMLREGEAIGVISVNRPVAGRFSDHQTNLLRTFADQAVIAIENVRLFNETKEALEQQTATAEILKVISESPTDTQPVFDAIVRAGLRLFPGAMVAVAIPEGAKVRAAAIATDDPAVTEAWQKRFPFPLSRDHMHGLAILDCRMVDVPDAETELNGPMGRGAKNFLASGNRAMTVMPMVCGDSAIGAISVVRQKAGALSEKQLALLRTFAAQAVIAIENVRVFKELEARTGALTRSVEQLTALGEVGQAISSTLDLETVLKTIVQRAVQITGLDGGSIYEYDEKSEEFHLRAAQNLSEEVVQVLRETPAHRSEGVIGRAVETGEPVEISEMLDDNYQSPRRDTLIQAGYRALLVVPLRRDEHIIGALAVNRKAPGHFSHDVVELLKTFATQSAMAIQNARLYREIAEKGRQLEQASQHKSNFLASMSHELRTPLNAILGFNEMILGQVYGEVPADMQEPLNDIQTSGKHLLRLINNVLDLAKIEAGRMELSLQDYSVHDLVGSVHSTLRPLAAEKGLEFLATVPEDLPLAYGDGGRITQCLMNLAGNSIKFTKAGRVEIVVAEKDGLLTYRVIDTGIGIPPDKIDSLFTEFKQTDATIASEYGGTGLGLSISKKFVEMHGGRIWIESELGKGSEFIIEVPLRVTTP